MPEPLRVDPIDLHMSANQLNVHHTDLQAAHAAADDDIQDAQGGWVGSSAAALQLKLVEWQATTEQLCGGIAQHERAFRSGAQQYETVDQDSAENITGQSE